MLLCPRLLWIKQTFLSPALETHPHSCTVHTKGQKPSIKHIDKIIQLTLGYEHANTQLTCSQKMDIHEHSRLHRTYTHHTGRHECVIFAHIQLSHGFTHFLFYWSTSPGVKVCDRGVRGKCQAQRERWKNAPPTMF